MLYYSTTQYLGGGGGAHGTGQAVDGVGSIFFLLYFVIVVCCLLDVGHLLCLHCYVRFLRGPRLEYSTNPPSYRSGGPRLHASRVKGVGLVGFGKEEGGRGSHLDLI